MLRRLFCRRDGGCGSSTLSTCAFSMLEGDSYCAVGLLDACVEKEGWVEGVGVDYLRGENVAIYNPLAWLWDCRIHLRRLIFCFATCHDVLLRRITQNRWNCSCFSKHVDVVFYKFNTINDYNI